MTAGNPPTITSYTTKCDLTGGADRRAAKNAARPMNQSREAHLPALAAPLPQGGHTGPGRSETVHEATRRSPCHRHDPTERPTRSHARVGMTLPPAASVGTGLISREARDVLSYRYATSPESSHTGYSMTKGAAQQGY